jgi:hypothetical protein
VDLDKILYGDVDIEDDLDSILFNPITSNFLKGLMIYRTVLWNI